MKKAFTLIELLIVLAVLATTVITGIVSFASYRQKKSLQSDILAMSIVTNRAYGLSLAPTDAFSGGVGGYGVYFNRNDSSPLRCADNNRYVLFKDLDNNHLCQASEKIEEFKLSNGIDFRYFTPAGSFTTIVFGVPVIDSDATNNPGQPYKKDTFSCYGSTCRSCDLTAPITYPTTTIAIGLSNKPTPIQRLMSNICTNNIRIP